MRPLVIGTAGHIDHGKTSLVQALTGVDTDRLAEERRRGITIELGFTHLLLPSGRAAGFVDVPGHERFVRMMIAGASGMDLVLLVIAADEGVMPQTREHLDILELLGVERGIVVLTKVDMVDEELLELARMDVADFVVGTRLEGAPIVPFSSVTGQGKTELLAAIEALAAQVPAPAVGGHARLAVDRVFSQRGFGTVVTGTLSSGAVALGDTLELLPAGIKVKVRGLQVHERDVERAEAGSRTAINLQGVERQTVDRGDVLATPGAVPVTSMIDAHVRVLAGAAHPLGARFNELTGEPVPLKEAVRLRLLCGTLEVLGRFQPLGVPFVAPGEAGFVQIRLERPIPASAGDRFVVRTESPMVTVAGGVVVNPAARRHRRRHEEEVVAQLDTLWGGCALDRVRVWLELAEGEGRSAQELMRLCRSPRAEVLAAIEQAVAMGDAARLDGERWVCAQVLEQLRDDVRSTLRQHHADRPLSPGATRGELRPGPWVSDKLLALVLGGLVESSELVQDGATYRSAGFEVSLGAEDAALSAALVDGLVKAGLTPPTLPQLLVELKVQRQVDDLVGHLVGSGQLLRVKEDLLFDPAAVSGLERQVRTFLTENAEMTPSDFKELTGLTRRHAIPLLEHLDKIQLTLRVGDSRRLRA